MKSTIAPPTRQKRHDVFEKGFLDFSLVSEMPVGLFNQSIVPVNREYSQSDNCQNQIHAKTVLGHWMVSPERKGKAHQLQLVAEYRQVVVLAQFVRVKVFVEEIEDVDEDKNLHDWDDQ